MSFEPRDYLQHIIVEVEYLSNQIRAEKPPELKRSIQRIIAS